jgi:hypothetical protein
MTGRLPITSSQPDGTQHSAGCGLDRGNAGTMVQREDGKAAAKGERNVS